jgi:hypothetical protein
VQILIHTHRQFWWLIFATFFGASLCVTRAETLVAPEYKIKAAFLYNFVKLTDWPTNAFVSSKAPIVIGVIGKDPFGRLLEDAVKNKIINGRKFAIERFKESNDAIAKCHLLFISKSEEERLDKILAVVTKQPVLTVSEIDGFNGKGGLIWLTKTGDEIKFRIKDAATNGAGLTFSSKLLALAISPESKKKEKK